MLKRLPAYLEICKVGSSRMLAKDDLFIPQYDEVYKNVLARYHDDFRAEGRHSYEYKIQTRRII